MKHAPLFALVVLVSWVTQAGAQSLDDIVGFRAYSATFASAGQPSAEQFATIREAGFDRIINLAFSTDRVAIANEDRLVRDLGMGYVHVPVVWNSPRIADYESFAAVMRTAPDTPTLLHCQVNMRASAFAFLYRVLEQDVPMTEAKADMNAIWQPNDVWRELIFDVLAAHGRSPDCAGCEW